MVGLVLGDARVRLLELVAHLGAVLVPARRSRSSPTARPAGARPGSRGSPRPRPSSPRSGRRSPGSRARRSRPRTTWKTNSRCRTPTWVAASPIPFASTMSCFIRSTSRRRSSSNSSTGRAAIFSAASGYWRICASASRRRACCSASSSSSLTCPSISAMRPDCTLADVDPRTLREIMSQGATRPETPQERREREQLEADLESSPVRGKPLRQRPRNFRPDSDLGRAGARRADGLDAQAARDRGRHRAARAPARRGVADTRRELEDPAEFAAAWRELADGAGASPR